MGCTIMHLQTDRQMDGRRMDSMLIAISPKPIGRGGGGGGRNEVQQKVLMIYEHYKLKCNLF